VYVSEKEKIFPSDLDREHKKNIPTGITSLTFFTLFCLLTLLYHITLYVFNGTVIIAFRIPIPPIEDESGVKINGLALILGIEFFGLLLNFYFTRHMTKSILNKWYNKIPMLQDKKLFVPTSILFMTLFPIISILWIIWIIAYVKNSTLALFFRSINGYVILLFLIGLSFYLSYKIIKKLQN
jgi:hypothetical protein